MLLLISDANILIDMEAGGLMEAFFSLPMRFAMPDVVYREEIEPGTPGLEDLGLELLEVAGEFVQYASDLRAAHGRALSVNDYLALALAKQVACPLLTGDQALRQLAQRQDIDVMGTVWILCQMVSCAVLDLANAEQALARMKDAGRRLPWADALRAIREASLRR